MSKFKTEVGEEKGYNRLSLHSDFQFIQQFGILNAWPGSSYTLDTKNSEFALLLLEGSCLVEVEGRKLGELNSRKDTFSGLPSAVYVPCDSQFSVFGGPGKVAICGGKCIKKTQAFLVTPEQVKIIEAGRDNWSRQVRLIISPDSPSVNIILGETLNPSGNWSGIPPAKHENNNLPEESLHEELYYFKVDKPQGWGIERLYSPRRDADELLYLRDNTVTFMPWGYHEIVAAPGYTLYYLFFLAGEGNKLAQFEDPDHNWIKQTES